MNKIREKMNGSFYKIIALIFSTIVILGTWLVTWGETSEKIENIEKDMQENKDDIKKIPELSVRVDTLEKNIDSLRSEVKNEIKESENRVKDEIRELKDDLKDEIKKLNIFGKDNVKDNPD